MENKNFDLEQLIQDLGINQDIVKELKTNNLSSKDEELLQNIFNLYLNDSEQFEQFLNDNGLKEILNKIEGTKQNQEELAELVSNLKEQLKN